MFDPVGICRILAEERVDFLVTGRFAGVIRGSSLPAESTDLIPDRNLDNLDRLGRALTRMNAKIRIAGDPVVTKIDGSFLANMPHMLNLVTDFGEMDIAFTPAGSAGDYEGWKKNATDETIADSLVVSVASLDDIIDSKKAANRPKDLLALPYLESLRDEIRRQEIG